MSQLSEKFETLTTELTEALNSNSIKDDSFCNKCADMIKLITEMSKSNLSVDQLMIIRDALYESRCDIGLEISNIEAEEDPFFDEDFDDTDIDDSGYEEFDGTDEI